MSNCLDFPIKISPPTYGPSDTRKLSRNIFERSPFKLALQKKGELTNLSLRILNDALNLNLTEPLIDNNNRTLFALNADRVGILFAKNNDLCQLVSSGSVDAAIVGLDQFYEFNNQENLQLIRRYPELGSWDIVLATPKGSVYKSIYDLKIIATQYPTIARIFFNKLKHTGVKVLKTYGSTEIYPLLKYHGDKIDGIIELRSTGNTLKANGMFVWDPPLLEINPVLIANKKSLTQQSKIRFFSEFKKQKYDHK